MPEMKLKQYAGGAIVVAFEATRCIHSARCLRALPHVFDVDARPWISPDADTADRVAAAVEGCPSGALTYTRLDAGTPEIVPNPAIVRVLANGPILVHGEVVLESAPGVPMTLPPRVALCRCGQSANKPFCDGTHRKVGFRAE